MCMYKEIIQTALRNMLWSFSPCSTHTVPHLTDPKHSHQLQHKPILSHDPLLRAMHLPELYYPHLNKSHLSAGTENQWTGVHRKGF